MSQAAILHEAIRDAADPIAVCDRIVRHCLALVPHADGVSLEMRRDADTLEYVSAAGTLAPFVGLQLPLEASLSGLAVLTGEVQRCPDASADPRVNAAAVRRTGIASLVCIPLSSRPDGVAALKVSSQERHAFTEDDIELLRRVVRFLDVIVNAASDLARTTAEVLSALTGEVGTDRGDLATARFVADVMTPGLADRVEDVSAVHALFEDSNLVIVVQPVVELATGGIVGCEALTRFTHWPDESPARCFDMAHRLGRSQELEMLVLSRALEALPQLPETVHMAINVGPGTVLHPDFPAAFDGMPLDRITLEMTEHDQVADYDGVTAALHSLREAGIQVSIDDTGSGYSGLVHLLRLCPDVIKLDRELVTGVDSDLAKQAMVMSLVAFAGQIGASVVAEGIETEEEAARLRELDVRFGQGFLYGAPMPHQEFAELLAV